MPTYPVDLEAWLAPFRLVSQAFDLGEGLSVQNMTAGGEVLRSGGAARLWRGSITLAPVQNETAADLEARIHALRGAGASFLIRDYRRGSGSIAVNLATIQGNGTVNISGGPANGIIRSGDYLSFTYSGRRALHQILTSGNLNGSGARNGVEVLPPIRPGWTAGQAARIGSGVVHAVMVPGSLRIGMAANGATDGISFDWTQTLRETP